MDSFIVRLNEASPLLPPSFLFLLSVQSSKFKGTSWEWYIQVNDPHMCLTWMTSPVKSPSCLIWVDKKIIKKLERNNCWKRMKNFLLCSCISKGIRSYENVNPCSSLLDGYLRKLSITTQSIIQWLYASQEGIKLGNFKV